MKKVLIASAALFFAAISSVSAQTGQASQPAANKKEVATTPATAQAPAAAQAAVEKNETVATAQPTKTPVKAEAIPEAVKATVAGEDYKGWIVSSAFLVNATSPYYELVLTKDKETKIVKLDANGKLI